MKRLPIHAFLLLLLAHPLCAQDLIKKKYALVIGVKDYEFVQPLKNSLNDAKDMSAILKTKGFQLIEVYNPKTKRELQDAIKAYFNLLNGQREAAGLVFYSGHSMQVDGVNYLMPTSASPELKADLDDQAVKMDYLLGAVEQAGNPLNIFIMDACRNNPFRSFSRSSDPGLSQVNAPKGSYVVYATAPGSVASDGTGRNGLFTSKLVKYINTPGIDIERVFKYVARDVQQESGGTQVPWMNISYFGDFYFSVAHAETYTPEVVKVERVESADELETKANNYYDQKNYTEAAIYFRKSADLGNTKSQNFLGYLYDRGYGVNQDYEEAVKWYRMAADNGNTTAQNNMGVMYRDGYGVPKDNKEAIKWFTKAANLDNASAQNNLGYAYEIGRGVEQSYSEALKWYRLSADQGNAQAQINLGILYDNGTGVPQDMVEAVKWFRKAADKGNATAQQDLGYMYANGRGVPQDLAEAVRLYRLSAEQGNYRGQNSLGYSYNMGRGVEKNYEMAVEWYRKAAEQGYATSQNNLGIMYRDGTGVTKDPAEAVKWFLKAANRGDAGAQNNLGVMYDNGTGVGQDYVEAEKWYRKSAGQGNAYGQRNLGNMFEFGRGVEINIEEATKWYKLAARQGNEYSIKRLEALGVNWR